MAETNPEIIPGSKVRMHFSLALPDGTEAISTFGDEPLEFEMGDGSLLPGLELALYGLQAGDRQTITLNPDQAYGFHDSELIHEMPISDFPQHLQPEAGQIVGFTTPGGDEAPGMVLKVTDDLVTVDFNHPLAGKDVIFTVEILQVQNQTQPLA